MKWLAIVAAVGIAFLSGYRMGLDTKIADKQPGLSGEFAQISQRELQEYMQLKDDKAKYEKANEILGRVMMLFIADMGLRVGNPDFNILDVAQSPRPPMLASPPIHAAPEPAVKEPALRADKAPAAMKERTTGTVEKKSTAADLKPSEFDTPANEVGAINALYLGVLWREPDAASLPSLGMRLRRAGWSGFVALARDMVGSSEFQRLIEPRHKPEQIVNHMYAVFLGRCPSGFELTGHLRAVRRSYTEATLAILEKAHTSSMSQIYNGGFNVNSCKE